MQTSALPFAPLCVKKFSLLRNCVGKLRTSTWFDCGSIERSRDAHQPLSDHRKNRTQIISDWVRSLSLSSPIKNLNISNPVLSTII
ncbi:MAG: hypothetical protein V7L20_27010 [Nostoc sp.]